MEAKVTAVAGAISGALLSGVAPAHSAAADALVLFPPLEHVTKPCLSTAEAAYYLNKKQQTLRIWASRESGPIRPRRINGRLSWATPDVKTLVWGAS